MDYDDWLAHSTWGWMESFGGHRLTFPAMDEDPKVLLEWCHIEVVVTKSTKSSNMNFPHICISFKDSQIHRALMKSSIHPPSGTSSFSSSPVKPVRELGCVPEMISLLPLLCLILISTTVAAAIWQKIKEKQKIISLQSHIRSCDRLSFTQRRFVKSLLSAP